MSNCNARKSSASLAVLAVCIGLTGPAQSLEIRFDPYRLWQGLEGYTGDDDDPVMFDIALDVPLENSMWGPQYSYYEDVGGTFHALGAQWTRMMERESGFYYGGGVNWLSIVPDSDFEDELADVCRPLVPLNVQGRWGYRWQFNPVFNVQLGLTVSAGEVTARQGERCVTDGEELDLGTVQNFVDPRLDFKFSFRL